MPNLTLLQFQNSIVRPGAAAPPVAQAYGAGNAYLRYDLTHIPAASRCTHNVVGINAAGMPALVGQPIASYLVTFAPAIGGNTFFLPFNNNEIHAVALPSNPGINDVRYVFTVNLSGCAVFVDDDPVNNRVYFHHANCIGGLYNVLNPAAHAPSTQRPLAVARLQQLHNNMLAHAGWNANAVPRASLLKAQYYTSLDTEWNRKRGQWRYNVEAWAGTTVWGYWNAGTASWDFWYQTFGSMTYDRRWYVPKGWVHGKQVTIMNKKADVLMDCQQFA